MHERFDAAFAACVLLTFARPAAADPDLAADASRLLERWSEPRLGLHATRLDPLFLEGGRPRAIRLPETSYVGLDSDGCTSIGVVSGRSVDFGLVIDPVIIPKHRPTGGFGMRSAAGIAFLVRCGKERESLERLAVELRGSRAALEIVVATGSRPAPEISLALPERATGPLAPPFDTGPRPSAAPLAERAHSIEVKAIRSGAIRVEHKRLTAGPEGMGAEALDLAEGCHRLVLMPEAVDGATGSTDLDADLRDGSTGRILSRDRSDATDARLDICSAMRSRRTLLAYAGAESHQSLLLSDAVFAVPAGVPRAFGPRAHAGLAAALFRHKFAPLLSPPTETSLGAAGTTPVHFPIEPGTCYVAAVAATAGEPRFVALSASVDTRRLYDATARGSEGAAIAFCAEQADRAYLEVEMRGGVATWLLALWNVARLEMGEKPW